MEKRIIPRGRISLERYSDGNPKSLNFYITSPSLEKPFFALPGLRHGDVICEKIKEDIIQRCNEKLPPSDHIPGGLASPGIPDTITRLRCCMGVPANPMGVPPLDNEGFKDAVRRTSPKSSPVENRYSAEDLEVFDWLLEMLIPDIEYTLTSVPVNRLTSFGLPDMAKDVDVKAALISPWFQNTDEVVSTIMSGELELLFEKYRMLFAYSNGFRFQPQDVHLAKNGEPVTKDRYVMDWKGVWRKQDFSLGAPYQHTGRQVRCRSRKLSVASQSCLFPLRILAKAMEGYLGSLDCFFFSDRLELTRRFENCKYVELSDVSNHDMQMPFSTLMRICDRISATWGDFFGYLCKMALTMPQLVRNDFIGGKGVRLHGDPFDLRTFRMRYGNPSGWPGTSLLAKIYGLYYVVIELIRAKLVNRDRGDIAALIRGSHPKVRVVVAGDNVALGVLDGWDGPPLWSTCPYAVKSASETMYGLIRTIHPGGGATFEPNPLGPIHRLFSADRDLYDPQRGDWAFGFMEGNTFALGHPLASQSISILDEVVSDYIGISVSEKARIDFKPPPVYNAISVYDREFIMNPDCIHYKVDSRLVSEGLLNLFYLNYGVSHILPLYLSLRKVKVSGMMRAVFSNI